MRFLDLRKQIAGNFFRILDVVKLFPTEHASTIRTQLYRLGKKGFIFQLKRGLYCFDKSTIDELALAEKLYYPSYISLETALNYYGIIPDIPMTVSSVTTITTKKIETGFGIYNYFKVDRSLFFGFSQTPFAIAYKEKALLDYFYLRRVRSVSPELRLRLSDWDWNRYREYSVHFPKWIQEIKLS